MKITELKEFRSLVNTDLNLFCKDIPASVRLIVEYYLEGKLNEVKEAKEK